MKKETERNDEKKEEEEDIYSKNLNNKINNNERFIDLNISLNFNNNKTPKKAIVKDALNNNLQIKNPDANFQNASFSNKNNDNINKVEIQKKENLNSNGVHINDLENNNKREDNQSKSKKYLNMEIISKKKKNEEEINNDLLNSKINELIESIKREHLNNLSLEKTYNEKIQKLDKIIDFKVKEKKRIMSQLSSMGKNLNKLIEIKIPNIIKNKKYSKQKSYEDLSKLKEKQLSNSAKRYNIMKKDIKLIKSKINLNTQIDKSITKENKFISNKSEELNFFLKKLNSNIIELKNEIKQLKNIKSYHEHFCDKKINKLREEKEYLKNQKESGLSMIENNKNTKKIELIKNQNNSYKLNMVNSMRKINISSENAEKTDITYKNKIPLRRIKQKDTLLINSYSSIMPYKTNNKASILPEILFSQQKIKKNESVAELSLRSLFSKNEKMIFEKYNLLPKKEIDYLEKKYENTNKQKNDSLQKIKVLNNKSSTLKIDISNKIKSNQKQIKRIGKNINGNMVKISINKTKIKINKKKINDVISKEKEMENELQRLNIINTELKEYLKIYENTKNLNQKNEDQMKIEETIKILIKSSKTSDSEKYNKENKKDEDKLLSSII